MTHGNISRPSIIGVSPVVETPFRRSGDSDPIALAALVDHLGSIGVDAVMYAGLASEMSKLGDAERDELTTIVIERAHGNGMTVVASVSDSTVQAAAERAERYAAVGADLVNVLPPPGAGIDAIRSHLATVLAAVAPTPVILQLVPGPRDRTLDAGVVAALAGAAPNLVQVKVETRAPGAFIAALRAAAPRLTCLVGNAGMDLPEAVRHGAVGVQPGCSATELYVRYWRLWTEGDTEGAEALHSRMRPYLSSWIQDVELIVAVEKRISRLRGLIPTEVCRSPRRVLTRHEIAAVDRFLDEFASELDAGHHSAMEPSS